MINNRKQERNNRIPRHKPTLKNSFNKNGIRRESDRPTKPKPIRKEETDD